MQEQTQAQQSGLEAGGSGGVKIRKYALSENEDGHREGEKQRKKIKKKKGGKAKIFTCVSDAEP